ncbi:MAG: Glu/Leu/Phe/Val dehydrogenase dimerization domain-containing protein [Gemmatimonadota bacterium]
MEELLRAWDGEKVVIRYDRETGAWIFIALHDRTLGKASGGCRMKVYEEPREGLRDALRLARGMTLKWAAIEFPFGGGKTVIALPRPLEPEPRRELLLRTGDLIESLGGTYATGEDMGTTPADMDLMAERTAHVFGRTPENGGSGDPGRWTALGVFVSIRAACERVFDGERPLVGRSVLVQGVGSVGEPLARRLAEADATVLVSDALPDRARMVAGELGGEVVAPQDVYDTECDVFAPCAVGGVLNARSIPRLRCRVVAGSANNQLETEADDERLRERGVLYSPDFVVNVGGAIALSGFEVLGWDEERVEARIRGIGETLGRILDDASARGDTPLAEARRRAERVLEEARRGTPAETGGYRTAQQEDERVPAT